MTEEQKTNKRIDRFWMFILITNLILFMSYSVEAYLNWDAKSRCQGPASEYGISYHSHEPITLFGQNVDVHCRYDASGKAEAYYEVIVTPDGKYKHQISLKPEPTPPK